jgi:hypothetical protein
MNARNLWLGTALIVATAAITTQVVSQDKNTGGAPQQMSGEERMWMEAGAVNENHKRLQPLIGEWKAEATFWMQGPDGPASTSTGSSTHKWVLGNRFVQQDYKGEMMGTQFTGIGYIGYDNIDKKYVGTWMDTMSTMIMSHSGTADASGKVLNMNGSFKTPDGKTFKDRHTTRIIDNNKHMFEMFHTGPDGKEVKVGEITYTRVK